ncbi:MAG: pyridine nucleotide-disulfide oxidoreductase, partial [Gammaproteobacteria bacterium]
VPSKALIHAARLTHTARSAARAGIDTGPTAIDFPRVMAHVREVIARIEPHDSVERYASLGVEVLEV